MTERFLKAVQVILMHEGGYVNHPSDPGGETKYGISKRSYPLLDIKNLTEERAIEIYYNDFWKRLRCDEIADENLALHVFDFAVNAGRGRAVKMLQKMLDTSVDGIIGPHTLKCANEADGKSLTYCYKQERIRYYKRLVERKPEMEVFLKGWVNRVISTRYA